MNQEILKKNFEAHGFKTSFFETKEEAANYLSQVISGKKVALGGSVTAQEMDLGKLLAKENEVIWHWIEPGVQTLAKARDAQIYITSANGVSETGELVNIDGTGNRASETLYGPQKTYFVVGSNKLEPNLHQALHRAKHVAAPRNAVRLGVKTPCAAGGGTRCYECSSPERICHATVILERPCKGMEVEVIFIEEPLGY